MSKSIYIGNDGKSKLLSGVIELAEAVKITLGPKGRNVILDMNGVPIITNDGVTIANNITFKDKVKNMGAQIVKSACIRTNSQAGDGTTTATILSENIFKEGLNYIKMGANPILLREGIKNTINFAIQQLKKQVHPVQDYDTIKQVASISSASEEVGKLIAEGYKKIGFNGIVTIEEGVNTTSSLEVVEGVRLPCGYISPYMCEEGKNVVEYENPYVLITDKKISDINDVFPIMEQVSKQGGSLVIIADEVTGEALNTIVINNVRKALKCLCVKAPFYAERKSNVLKDLALILGTNVISENSYIKFNEINLEMLGRCKKIKADKDKTTIMGLETDKHKIDNMLIELKEKRKVATDYERECIDYRINMMCGAIAVIKVGANSDVELKELKLRIEDAINATTSAIEEGVIVGGGTALVKIVPYLNEFIESQIGDERLGGAVVKNSMQVVLKQIAKNSGIDADFVLKNVLTNPNFNYGYNAAKNEYGDMIDFGVIDPFKVIRTALITAGSVASTLLTTECVVAEEEKI